METISLVNYNMPYALGLSDKYASPKFEPGAYAIAILSQKD